MEKQLQKSPSSKLSSKTEQPNGSNEIKATKQFFRCKNCGHMNSKNDSERHMEKRKRSNSDMGVDFTPKLFNGNSSLSDTQLKVKEASPLTSHSLLSSTPIQQQRSGPCSELDVDSLKSKNIITPRKVEAKLMKIPKTVTSLSEANNRKEQDISTPKNRKRRLYFAGDEKDDTHLTPRSSKKFIWSLKKTVIEQRKKIRAKGQTIRRQRQRIVMLKSLLDDLRKKNLISENASGA